MAFLLCFFNLYSSMESTLWETYLQCYKNKKQWFCKIKKQIYISIFISFFFLWDKPFVFLQI